MKLIGIILVILLTCTIAGGIYFYNNDSNHSDTRSPNQEGIGQKTATESQNNNSGGERISSELLNSFSVEQIMESNEDFYPTQSILTPKYSVDRYTMKYTSYDTKREIIQISAQVFIPKGSLNESFPLYVFGQGTTGIGDQCAPSREEPTVSNWGNYRAHMLAYASQGYIVVFPDYAGFNDPDRIHHYFNAELESNVLLDGTRATLDFLNETGVAQPENSVFYAGYSQGGHAAFAVKDRAAEYAPEIPIKGVIGYGATTDMIALLKENPTLAPYVFYAYQDLYGSNVVQPTEYLQQHHLQTFDQDASTICIGDIYEKYGYNARTIYSEDFYSALFEDRLEQEFPEFYALLVQNNTGLVSNTIPSLVLQGATDPIVTVKSQKKFLQKVCSTDTSLTYIEYPGIHHYQTRQTAIRDSIAWMETISSGTIPDSDCGNI